MTIWDLSSWMAVRTWTAQDISDHTHRRTKSVVWQVDFQAKVDMQQGLGELLDGGRVGKIELIVGLEAADGGQHQYWQVDRERDTSAHMARKSASWAARRPKSGSDEYRKRK